MLLWMTLTVNWLESAEAFVNESSPYPDVTTASTIIKSSFHSSQMSKFANLSLRCADLQVGQYPLEFQASRNYINPYSAGID